MNPTFFIEFQIVEFDPCIIWFNGFFFFFLTIWRDTGLSQASARALVAGGSNVFTYNSDLLPP